MSYALDVRHYQAFLPARPVADAGLVALDPSDREQVEALASLHARLQPASLPAQLGRRFLTGFYFSRIVADGLASADLFRSEGRWVGYAFYTRFPRSFLREAIRSDLLFLLGFLPSVVATNPRALAALPRLLRDPGGLPETPRTGYLLAAGVEPAFRHRGVGTRLMDAIVRDFRRQDFAALEATVDRDDAGARAFYESRGFRLEDRGLAGGARLQARLELRPHLTAM